MIVRLLPKDAMEMAGFLAVVTTQLPLSGKQRSSLNRLRMDVSNFHVNSHRFVHNYQIIRNCHELMHRLAYQAFHWRRIPAWARWTLLPGLVWYLFVMRRRYEKARKQLNKVAASMKKTYEDCTITNGGK